MSVEQRVSFSRKEMAPLEKKSFKVTKEREASVAKAEQLWLEVQYVPGTVKEAKKLRERVRLLRLLCVTRF